jgi:hypothetical protein
MRVGALGLQPVGFHDAGRSLHNPRCHAPGWLKNGCAVLSAPDATWIFGREFWVAWEAKSDANPDGEVDARSVRQASSHIRFIEAHQNEAAPGDSITF